MSELKEGGFSSGSDFEYEGGKVDGKMSEEVKQNYLKNMGIIVKDGKYYQAKSIEDRGFIKWSEAYETTAKVIKWVALFISFKFYRMTYSFFMGRKQFLILYQKKKFKKSTVVLTLLSMFFVELPIIICDVVAITSVSPKEQLFYTMVDSLAIAIFMVVAGFVEVARLDKIMKTMNTKGHR